MARRARPILYGPNGRPISAAAWDSASQDRRARHWRPTRSHVNALLSGEVETIRTRSRDELRRNPWAGKASTSFVANLVGTGIRPKPQTEEKKFRQEILDTFADWCEESDADGTCSFYGQQALAARAFMEGGDAFVRLRPRLPRDGLVVPLQLQLLEAEMCDASKNGVLPNGHLIKAGIEFDAVGRRTAYWMFRTHPGEVIRPFSQGMESVPVPASQIIHLFHVTRPGQVRGVPGLASVLAMLHEIREVDDAHVLRHKIQNLYATFETVPDREGSVLDAAGDEEDADDVPQVTAAAGSHVLLPQGHEIHFGKPPTDGIDYEAFIRVKLRSVAAGVGTTYEQITGDLSNVNFSSIRAGLIEVRRELEQIQHNVMIFQLCRPVWRRWFETAVLSGAIQVPASEQANMRRLLRARWQPPGFEYVEPEKDVKAAVRRIRAGLSSPTREAAKLGIDVEDLFVEISRDMERARELGLVLDSDPKSDQDGQARASAVGGAGDSGEAGEGGEAGRDAA